MDARSFNLSRAEILLAELLAEDTNPAASRLQELCAAHPDLASDLERLGRWQSGDERARDDLLAEVQPWLRREMSKALGGRPRDVEDSVDLAQTAVLGFLTWKPAFLPENDAQLRALLRRIARNGFLDAQRARARGRGGGLASTWAPPEPAERSSLGPARVAQREEGAAWMRLALEFMEPEERELLLAREVDGTSWGEIAELLGFASPDAARVRCMRLKAHLARVMLELRAGRLPQDT
jgi:RNA polymerase sigma factor (sigma-70 family)